MLLLYSGGLDTSRDAALDPGALRRRGRDPDRRPRPARRGLGGGHRQGARARRGRDDPSSTPARSSPRDYVLPAIKANALYGGGYPLFTALGRPLIAKLAVERGARARAATRSPTAAPARATTRCGSTARSRRSTPSSKCSPRCATGRWAARRRSPTRASTAIPLKGGTEAAPYSIDDNLWGRSSEGRSIEDLEPAAARRRLPARHAARSAAPDEPRAAPGRLRGRAARSRSTASASAWSS